MKDDLQRHRRRSIRVAGFDYGQPGSYFVTLCAWQRAVIFGSIGNGDMRLSSIGRIVVEEWNRLTDSFANISLDALVVMPNHLHGIITIHELASSVRATHPLPANTPSGMGGRPPRRKRRPAR